MPRTRTILLAALAVAVVAGAALWWFFFRDTSPPPPSLDDVTQTTEAAGETTTTAAPALDSIEGEWALVEDGTSYVGYRVQEELANIGGKTAVGRTPLVTAGITVSGNQVTAVVVDADLRGLESDDSRRDGALRRQSLETDTFPDAGFVLTSPVDLPPGVAGGEPFQVTVSGELTLHGVTRSIEVPLEAQLTDGRLAVVGSLPIAFADYDIEKPTSMLVLSVEDNGVMELLLVFEPAG